jgi:hypothetical protein
MNTTPTRRRWAAPDDERPLCTQGRARSVLEAGTVGFAQSLTGSNGKGIAYSVENCQVQLSLDGAHYTYAAREVFAFQQTWLAPVLPDGSLGPATELDLRTTPVKTMVFQQAPPFPEGDPLLACFDSPATQVHYRMTGTILGLPPGEYVTTTVGSYAGEELYTAVVRITIVPD